ncbi:polyprenyl synthetase family protein [Persicimonas caeni]|uniref:Polyprenyl synthetase family protein n=1 Tax=Persicimonas caeni TaxID=2292766 RepID=A0A4Y6Q1E4_PERCE|nr:polyprenyl synthetase family protein [Persicimonas caeni]QDG54404.1 polyprenyl synthetase family protein [Persicimonas caeni]QED35625.1 polyprenyl synthetase family protein [Persicimonas caeni]
MNALRQLSNPDAKFVESVEHRLRTALAPQASGNAADRILSEASQHLSLAQAAKRARPRLLLYFARAVGADEMNAALVDVAVVAELIHTASLMHDDVIDEATVRRGQPSVNAQWSNCVAVLGGDAMLCTGLQMLEPYGMKLMQQALEVVAQMTRGVVLEVQSRGQTDVTDETWRSIADGKTGILFGWCGWAPAMLAGKPDVAERFHRAGHHLGVAFQIADDLKDLTGADKGKDRFVDIRTRTPAFPLVWAMSRSEMVRDRLTDLWTSDKTLSDEEIHAAGALVLESGALEATKEALRVEIDAALDALGEYAQRPGGREIAGFAMHLRTLLEPEQT